MVYQQIKKLKKGHYILIEFPRMRPMNIGVVTEISLKEGASGENPLNDYSAKINVFDSTGKWHHQSNDIVIDSEQKWNMIIPAEIESYFLLRDGFQNIGESIAYGKTYDKWTRTDFVIKDGVRRTLTWTLIHHEKEGGWTLSLDKSVNGESAELQYWDNLATFADIQDIINAFCN